MATGYRNAAGVDFDDLFDPYISGTSPPATGFRVSGVDLAGRYAPIALGTKGPNVNYRTAAGVDLSNLWAAKGTASYSIAGFNGRTISANDGAATNQPSVTASVSFSLASSGAWSISGGTSQGAATQTNPTSGTWNTFGGAASDYEALIEVVSSSGSSGFTNSTPSGWLSLGTTRGASASLPSISANNTTVRTGSITWRVRIRRASTGAVVSDNTINGSVRTQGWQ